MTKSKKKLDSTSPKPKAPVAKISVSLPSDLVEDLDVICGAFRVTRSALITQLLVDGCKELRAISEQFVLPNLESGRMTERAVADTLERLGNQIQQAKKEFRLGKRNAKPTTH